MVLAAVAVTALSAPAAAQDPDARGLSLVVGLGYEVGSPGPLLVEQFEAAGMDQDRPGTCAATVCDATIEYPFHYREGLGVVLTGGFRYRTRWPVSLEVLVSNGVWGHAAGNNEARNENLAIVYAPAVLSATVGLHLGPLRLGAGPALNRTSWSSTLNTTRTGSDRSVTVGAAGSATFEVRVRGVGVAGRIQARGFPDVAVANPLDLELTGRQRTVVFGLSVRPITGGS